MWLYQALSRLWLQNQDISVPVNGPVLLSVQGNTCAVNSLVPGFLSQGGTYEVEILGTRDVNGVPGAFYALVNINGLGAVRLDFPTITNDFVLATTPDGTEFTGQRCRHLSLYAYASMSKQLIMA
ncbi:hypothetical protein WJX73_006460 [Symbiochloris irregularis]|uniref:Uncharacterized protein n=1 Tax=Symbiochloris irregularis TaxID=706552 RepID=A0AAW1PWJ2_9CHLO